MSEELHEASQVREQTQILIDTLGGAGLPDRSILVGMHLALVERLLASGGVAKAQQFLRDQADQLDEWGEPYITALRG